MVLHREVTTEVAVLPRGADPGDDGAMLHFAFRVVWRSPRHYAVIRNGFECLSRSGTWDRESSPSNRTDDWVAEHRFTMTEAVDAARALVDDHKVNGKTWAEWEAFATSKARA